MQEEHVPVVVVGSGFGGSVMAYRVAEAGIGVCLLERGQAYPPGSFARSKAEFSRAFWDPSEGLYGLYNLWSFKRAGALTASGLGGGSLIYANVLIRKDECWFVTERANGQAHEAWPVSRRELDPHYDAVARLIPLQKYPIAHQPSARRQKP
jgi:cholesterol oxidase